MRRIILTFLALLIGMAAASQADDCRTSAFQNFELGKESYEKGYFGTAKKYFGAAANCSLLSRAEKDEMALWVRTCVLMDRIADLEADIKKTGVNLPSKTVQMTENPLDYNKRLVNRVYELEDLLAYAITIPHIYNLVKQLATGKYRFPEDKEFLSLMNSLHEIAQFYNKVGDIEHAAECYYIGGMCLVRHQNYWIEDKWYMAARFMDSAARCYLKIENSSKAAECYYIGGVCWLNLGNSCVISVAPRYDFFSKAEYYAYHDSCEAKLNNAIRCFEKSEMTYKYLSQDIKDEYKVEPSYLVQDAKIALRNALFEYEYYEAKMFRAKGLLRVAEICSKYLCPGDREIEKIDALEKQLNAMSGFLFTPFNDVVDSSTYVYIIANENYDNRRVPYAINDGFGFYVNCIRILGIPDDHIVYLPNANLGDIIKCVADIKKLSKAFDGEINVIFYYAGHAFPDEESKAVYLLPVDGESSIVESCYSLKRLYKELGEAKAQSTICFFDACFTGTTREDDMLLTGRGVSIKPKEETPQGNLVVFTSASGNETAHQYEAKQHGLFTYFLLEKLKETKGDVSLGELSDYIYKNVKRISYTVNGKLQTPSTVPSPSMEQTWRNVKL